MATISQDLVVSMRTKPTPDLTYPPAATGTLVIAVHAGAFKAKGNRLTQVAQFVEGELAWAGALDEGMVQVESGAIAGSRGLLAAYLLQGPRVWQVVRPGELRPSGKSRPDTVYQGDRPWVVVAGPGRYGLLAMPLNDAAGRMGAWHHFISGADLVFPASKDSKLEMNHLWSFPETLQTKGYLAQRVRESTGDAIRAYYA